MWKSQVFCYFNTDGSVDRQAFAKAISGNQERITMCKTIHCQMKNGHRNLAKLKLCCCTKCNGRFWSFGMICTSPLRSFGQDHLEQIKRILWLVMHKSVNWWIKQKNALILINLCYDDSVQKSTRCSVSTQTQHKNLLNF